jgi:hypothetical protein
MNAGLQRIHVSAILYVAVGVWAASLLSAGVNVGIELLRPLSLVTGAVALAVAGFEVSLWRITFLQGWFVKRPNLRGTWALTLHSDWVDSATGHGRGPIEAYVVIRQTYSSISLRLMTAESESKMLGTDIVEFPDGRYVVTGVYQNLPRLSLQHRSRTHNGAILLNVRGAPPESIDGTYWTDRKTQGEIMSTVHVKAVTDTFAKARIACAEALPKGPEK